jgi:hypothetical protein
VTCPCFRAFNRSVFQRVEPIPYFLVLGVCGTYIGFLAGNIPNFRLPVSAVAQAAAQVEEGSTEGELVSTVAIVVTQVMITLSALLGALFVGAIVRRLPATVIAAFDWLLPSIGARWWCSSGCATGATR